MDWKLLLSHTVTMLVAYVLAMPIAWNREKLDRSAGLRTFPLVSLASCGFVLLALSAWPGAHPDAEARILQGLITGIGFVGGGAILKYKTRVRGTATAASIWSTGALGAAVAFGRYEIAFLLSVATFATLRWLSEFKEANGVDSSDDL